MIGGDDMKNASIIIVVCGVGLVWGVGDHLMLKIIVTAGLAGIWLILRFFASRKKAEGAPPLIDENEMQAVSVLIGGGKELDAIKLLRSNHPGLSLDAARSCIKLVKQQS